MQSKHLSTLQVTDLNGIWESKTIHGRITYKFDNGQLTKSDNKKVCQPISVKIQHGVTKDDALLVCENEIQNIEMCNEKFLILKSKEGLYLLLVKFPWV